ncbi:DNA-directed RNA polymerase subunit A', partial [Candidatus Bathyarchaeota archaeon]
MYQYLSQRKPKKIILGIKFGLLSPELIRKMSVTEIVTSETYDEDGMPIRAGPMDRRLGTIEPGVRCETCGNYVGQCPGHFGHIELERPVIHVEFVKYIHTLLRATCRHCGRILLPEEEIEKYLKKIRIYEKRWKPLKQHLIKKIIKKTIKNNQCPYCGEKQYKIKLEKPMSFYEERERGVLTRLNPKEIRSRLERIPDKDLILLGFDPEYARP